MSEDRRGGSAPSVDLIRAIRRVALVTSPVQGNGKGFQAWRGLETERVVLLRVVDRVVPGDVG